MRRDQATLAAHECGTTTLDELAGLRRENHRTYAELRHNTMHLPSHGESSDPYAPTTEGGMLRAGPIFTQRSKLRMEHVQLLPSGMTGSSPTADSDELSRVRHEHACFSVSGPSAFGERSAALDPPSAMMGGGSSLDLSAPTTVDVQNEMQNVPGPSEEPECAGIQNVPVSSEHSPKSLATREAESMLSDMPNSGLSVLTGQHQQQQQVLPLQASPSRRQNSRPVEKTMHASSLRGDSSTLSHDEVPLCEEKSMHGDMSRGEKGMHGGGSSECIPQSEKTLHVGTYSACLSTSPGGESASMYFSNDVTMHDGHASMWNRGNDPDGDAVRADSAPLRGDQSIHGGLVPGLQSMHGGTATNDNTNFLAFC